MASNCIQVKIARVLLRRFEELVSRSTLLLVRQRESSRVTPGRVTQRLIAHAGAITTMKISKSVHCGGEKNSTVSSGRQLIYTKVCLGPNENNVFREVRDRCTREAS